MPRPPESMNNAEFEHDVSGQPMEPLSRTEFERRYPESSVEPQIPTLNTIAVPEESTPYNHATFESVLIGSARHGLSMGAPPPETQLTAADIAQISQKLREVLIPEIEKAVAYAMNHAFALAMDQASHVMRHKVHAKLDELLPKLVEHAIRNPKRPS